MVYRVLQLNNLMCHTFEFQRRTRSGGEGVVVVLRKCPFDTAYNLIW